MKTIEVTDSFGRKNSYEITEKFWLDMLFGI